MLFRAGFTDFGVDFDFTTRDASSVIAAPWKAKPDELIPDFVVEGVLMTSACVARDRVSLKDPIGLHSQWVIEYPAIEFHGKPHADKPELRHSWIGKSGRQIRQEDRHRLLYRARQ